MLTVVTGLPGHGKTLNTIKEIEELHPDRQIYYAHIDDLKIERWNKIDDVKRWYEIEHGAVIVIDECHHYFPRRGNTRSAEPEHVAKITEHRHFGHDLYFITQDAKNIDHFVRRLAGRHVHYWRPFGGGRSARWEWQKVVQPDDKQVQKEAISKRFVKLDKKYFGVYHSAEVHTVKRKLPKKLVIFPAAISVVVFCAFLAYNSLTSSVASDVIKDDLSVMSVATVPAQTPALTPSPVPSRSWSSSSSSSDEDLPIIRLSGVSKWPGGGVAIFQVGSAHVRLSLPDAGCSGRGVRWKCSYNGVEYQL